MEDINYDLKEASSKMCYWNEDNIPIWYTHFEDQQNYNTGQFKIVNISVENSVTFS